MMKFLLDENMPNSSVKMLEEMGYEAEHVRNMELLGEDDKEIARLAKEKESILVSKDKHFGNPYLYGKDSHHGLVIIRLPYNYTAKQITKYFEQFMEEIDVERLENHITVLELGSYRIKDIPDEK